MQFHIGVPFHEGYLQGGIMAFVPQRLVILAIFVVRAFGSAGEKWEKSPFRYILVANTFSVLNTDAGRLAFFHNVW